MILIKNYEKYMNDKVLADKMLALNENENYFNDYYSKRLFEELKHQLNEVDKYQLKLKALETDIETLRQVTKLGEMKF